MKNKKRFIIIGVIGIIILVIFGVTLMHQSKIKEDYEYISNGYAIGSILVVENENYLEINKNMFDEIFEILSKQSIESYEKNILGRINYNNGVDDWKFKVFGSDNIEKRILLKGEEAYIFNDANYPEIYFCRKDIFNKLKGELESLEGVNIDTLLD